MPVNLPDMHRFSADKRQILRGRIERLIDRAQYLAPADRALVEQVYGQGTSLAAVARLMGQPPRTLQRRFGRIMQRVNSKEFTFVCRHQALLSGPQRQVARKVIFQGQTLRQAAAYTGMSLHQVRRHLHEVQALARV